MRRIVLAVFFAVAICLPSRALTVTYDVRTPHPTNHLFEVTIELGELTGDHVDLAMPAWTPGYYRIQNHARNVREFHAAGPDGTALAFTRPDKQTWRIETGGAGSAIVSYRVFARSLSATGSELSDEHAYFHGSWLFMYLVDAIRTPVVLRLHPREGWKIATGLEPGKEPDTFTAPDYDVLIDCPVEMGTFSVDTFVAGGVPHDVVVHGDPRCDHAAMIADVRKIVETQIALMGGAPYKRYVFLFHFPRFGSGGLEHLNSTSIIVNGEELGDRGRYERFLFIVSHEFFHLWNVKRIRPAQLGPFDYAKEVHTRNLWVHEGWTTYYGWLAMERAGVIDRKQYVNYLQEEVNNLLRRDGRRITSPETSSWNTWYESDDPESTEVSYYTSGHLVGLLLDMEIRRRTRGEKSLDDVMRLASAKTADAGYPADDFLAIVNEAAGGDYREFFEAYVSGTAELPYGQDLSLVGIQYEAKDEGAESDPGFDVQGIGEDLVRVTRVREGSPADKAGFDNGDILLAADGKRLRAGTFWNVVHGKKPGETIAFTVFRGERLIEESVTLAERRKISHQVRLMEKPSDVQKHFLDGWLK